MTKLIGIPLLILLGWGALSIWSTPRILLEAVRDSDVSTDGGVTLVATVQENGRRGGVAGILVDFQSSGTKFQQAKTNGAGVATINVTLPEGRHRLEARYLDGVGVPRLSNIAEHKVEKSWTGAAYTAPRTSTEAALQADLLTMAAWLIGFVVVVVVLLSFVAQINTRDEQVDQLFAANRAVVAAYNGAQAARMSDWQKFAEILAGILTHQTHNPIQITNYQLKNQTAHGGRGAGGDGGGAMWASLYDKERPAALSSGERPALGDGEWNGAGLPAFVTNPDFKIIGEE